jgi:hypothetical protein
MKIPYVPQDDLLDVMEMTKKIEGYITRVLKNNDFNLAMSALMSASINCMFAQCNTLDEIVFYRNLFMQILDSSIRQIQIKKPEKSS